MKYLLDVTSLEFFHGKCTGCAAAIINSIVTGGPLSCDCGGTTGSGCC